VRRVSEVMERLEVGADIVQVRVQVPVCQTCGERYYDRATMRHLEGVERELREGSGKTHETGRVLQYG